MKFWYFSCLGQYCFRLTSLAALATQTAADAPLAVSEDTLNFDFSQELQVRAYLGTVWKVLIINQRQGGYRDKEVTDQMAVGAGSC